VKIYNLTRNSTTYTSNAYFIRGEWNTLRDVNTLIDVGRDPVLFSELEKISTGVGKTKIERVLLTHSHYDHVTNLGEIRKRWSPKVYAASRSVPGITKLIRDGEMIRIADQHVIAIACPGHSSDSVCFYSPNDRILFAGDTQLTNLSNGNYEPGFARCLEKISQYNVQAIYPGHGQPITENCNKKIAESLKVIKRIHRYPINIK